jgi:hypothetical protein
LLVNLRHAVDRARLEALHLRINGAGSDETAVFF